MLMCWISSAVWRGVGGISLTWFQGDMTVYFVVFGQFVCGGFAVV